MTAWRDHAAFSGSALALALETFAAASERHERDCIEIVWTGPATEIVQARHTSAVLFELIALARNRLTLASFSSYPIAGLIERLQSALDRSVQVELLLESSYDSNRSDATMRRAFESVRQFVTPHAASSIEEFLAESGRAYLGANDAVTLWPAVTRARLDVSAPIMAALFEGILAELRQPPERQVLFTLDRGRDRDAIERADRDAVRGRDR